MVDLYDFHSRSGTRKDGSTTWETSTGKLSLTDGEPHIYALVDYEDAYVEPKILAALRKHTPTIKTVRDVSELPKDAKVVHWSAYEKIPFEEIMGKPESMLSCSYIIR